ncbi:HEL060Wp [Eremothecium sinecaudum]|uniref:Pre-mRNA-processing protein 45 n=1 Tax=Eremothecium sinecaudum TaxID=45286 RepID=A0A0X8HTJ9_9SACH|nr:HEL060Wp [Eremothecium sinecaudum]AMD21220.1 HEL060Wp [Eremothecium sinecaudum]
MSTKSFTSLLPEPKNINTNNEIEAIRSLPSSNEPKGDDILVSVAEQNIASEVSFQDFIPIRQRDFDINIPLPSDASVNETYVKTKAFFDTLINTKLRAAGDNRKTHDSIDESIKVQGGFGNQENERIVRVVDHVSDPLQPSHMKIKKVLAKPSEEPPAPILHKSDARLSKEERDKWEIPAAVSSWKNPNGYTIGLDKRVAMDGRYTESEMGGHELSERFVELAEALDFADKKARKELAEKAEARKQLAELESREKEEKLRKLAQKAREERERSRYQRNQKNMGPEVEASRREYERNQKMQQMDKEVRLSKLSTADKLRALAHAQGRDVSEKVILGAAKSSDAPEVHYDARLFTRGANAAAKRSEDQTYDTPLFSQRDLGSRFISAKFTKAETTIEKTISSIKEDVRFDELHGKRSRAGSENSSEMDHKNDDDSKVYGLQVKKHKS